MKQTYIAPQLECLCLAPAETVATMATSFDEYIGESSNNAVSTDSVVVDPDKDIDIVL